MKNHHQGFGIVEVIVIILIIGVLGGVGWIGYRMFTKHTTASSSSTSSDIRDLVFENWNVALTIPKSSNLYGKVAAPVNGVSYDNYYVYDTDFDRACSDAAENKSIGALSRVKADDRADSYLTDQPMTNREYFTKNPDGAVINGAYVYFYTKANGSYECTSPNGSQSQKAIDALANARTTLTKSLSSLHDTTNTGAATTLSIKEWGVQFKLASPAITDAYYTAPSVDSATGLDHIGLGTKATNVELECADGSKTQQTTINNIYRSTNKDKVVTGASSDAKKVGDYYYSIEFEGGAGCDAVSANAPRASDVSKKFIENFEAGNLTLE